MIRTVFVVVVTFMYIFLTGPPGLLWAYLTGSARLLYLAGRGGAHMALCLGGMRVRVYGREKLDRDKPCVYVVNHTSIIDPVVVWGWIPHDAAGLGKKEFFRLPILGRACKMAGFISVDRQNPELRVKAGAEAAEWIRERGKTYVVFAEGTRSRDGRLKQFKKGAAIMAISAQADIVPVAVTGCYALWPKGRWFFRPGTVQMHFLDPISTLGMTFEDKERLTHECRRRIAEHLRAIDPDLVDDSVPAEMTAEMRP